MAVRRLYLVSDVVKHKEMLYLHINKVVDKRRIVTSNTEGQVYLTIYCAVAVQEAGLVKCQNIAN